MDEELPNLISHEVLLRSLFERSIGGMSDDELLYFLELVQSLKDAKEKADIESWWNQYYK